ncbi:hypothetical protein AOLI_G00046130 [Acnodon oligacanthus]
MQRRRATPQHVHTRTRLALSPPLPPTSTRRARSWRGSTCTWQREGGNGNAIQTTSITKGMVGERIYHTHSPFEQEKPLKRRRLDYDDDVVVVVVNNNFKGKVRTAFSGKWTEPISHGLIKSCGQTQNYYKSAKPK